jgi:hypothetical protein
VVPSPIFLTINATALKNFTPQHRLLLLGETISALEVETKRAVNDAISAHYINRVIVAHQPPETNATGIRSGSGSESTCCSPRERLRPAGDWLHRAEGHSLQGGHIAAFIKVAVGLGRLTNRSEATCT